MKIIICAALLIGGLVCDSATNPKEVAPGEAFELKYLNAVHISGTGLTIQFRSVKEDSRCPEGAVCVWQGNARVGITINKYEADLNTFLDSTQVTYSGWIVRLLNVSPYPKLQVSRKPEEYSIRLIVLKE